MEALSEMLETFARLIEAYIGLNIKQENVQTLHRAINGRAKFHKISLEEYYLLITNDSCKSHEEWNELILLLTIGESYFFRDKGQFHLLEKHILPLLIAQRKSQRQLSIWSAGCSSGEEPYSIAIALHKLLPDIDKWEIKIFATDINNSLLAKAKQGCYGEWSFRMVDNDIKNQYFYRCGSNWQLRDDIKSMVNFYNCNLVKDDFPSYERGLFDVDLILCRNVFIYFSYETIAKVANKFMQTLNKNGYLITGHNEMYGQKIAGLQTQIFSESVIFQRVIQGLNVQKSAQNLAISNISKRPVAKSIINTPLDSLRKKEFTLSPCTSKNSIYDLKSAASNLFAEGKYNLAMEKAALVLQNIPNDFDALYLIAQISANLGKYKEAYRYCEEALKINCFALDPYYLLAHLSEEYEEDFSKAKELLRKIIYLSPQEVAAHLQLASYYRKEGDFKRMQKMCTRTLEILQKLPEDTTIKRCDNSQVKELINYVENMLQNNKEL